MSVDWKLEARHQALETRACVLHALRSFFLRSLALYISVLPSGALGCLKGYLFNIFPVYCQSIKRSIRSVPSIPSVRSWSLRCLVRGSLSCRLCPFSLVTRPYKKLTGWRGTFPLVPGMSATYRGRHRPEVDFHSFSMIRIPSQISTRKWSVPCTGSQWKR